MRFRQNVWRTMVTGFVVLVISSAGPGISYGDQFLELPGGPRLDLSQKCPVCGMAIGGQQGQGVTVIFRNGRVVEFGGVAAAVFKNGHVVGFEGARCLFIYNSVPQKYDVDVPNISKQYVTNFVTKKMIELSEAFLVLGSNVMGPMGYDLIPFGTKAEATRFATENDGKWIVQLHEVDRNLTARPQDGQTDSLGKESQKLPEKSEKEPKRNKKESPAAEPRYPAPRTGPSGHHMH